MYIRDMKIMSLRGR